MKGLTKILSVMVLAIGMLMPLQANAKTLYGTANNGADFITIDSTTGVATLVTTFAPAGQYYAMEFTPDGILWAIEANSCQLYKVAPATGALTPVGTPTVNGLFTQLASDRSGNLYATGDVDDVLYSIDKTTGQATAIGSTGIAAIDVGVSFNRTEVLYGINGAGSTLHTIDPATGAATLVAPITGPIPAVFTGLMIDKVTGIAYVMDYSNPSSLYTLDLTTGVTTLVGATGISSGLDMAMPWPVVVGSGGCALNTQAGLDPLLPVLALLAIGFLYRRRSGARE